MKIGIRLLKVLALLIPSVVVVLILNNLNYGIGYFPSSKSHHISIEHRAKARCFFGY